MSEPSNQPAPRFVVCNCQHCDGHIEFDADAFAEEYSIVPCPHCRLETKIFIPVQQAKSVPPELSSPVDTPSTVRREGFFDGTSEMMQESLSDGHSTTSPQAATLIQPPPNSRPPSHPKPQREATEAQLDYIRGLGGNPPPNLTISDASQLIKQLLEAESEQRRHATAERLQWPAYHLHEDYERAKRDVETAEKGEIKDANMLLKDARDERLSFWQDTFLSPSDMSFVTEQSIKLYLEHGHRFKKPSEKRILAILETLDAHSPTWDKNGTVSFYLTLEASFPELLKKEIDYEVLEIDKEWLDFKFQ